MQTRHNQKFIQKDLVILAQGAFEAIERGFFFLPSLGD